MLLDGLADSEETSAEFLSTIVENCKRLTRLINDVLDLSKIEAGRMQFKLEKLGHPGDRGGDHGRHPSLNRGQEDAVRVRDRVAERPAALGRPG